MCCVSWFKLSTSFTQFRDQGLRCETGTVHQDRMPILQGTAPTVPKETYFERCVQETLAATKTIETFLLIDGLNLLSLQLFPPAYGKYLWQHGLGQVRHVMPLILILSAAFVQVVGLKDHQSQQRYYWTCPLPCWRLCSDLADFGPVGSAVAQEYRERGRDLSQPARARQVFACVWVNARRNFWLCQLKFTKNRQTCNSTVIFRMRVILQSKDTIRSYTEVVVLVFVVFFTGFASAITVMVVLPNVSARPTSNNKTANTAAAIRLVRASCMLPEQIK